MDYRALIFGAVLALTGVAHAGYAQLANPERFSGSPGNWTFAPSANDARYGKIAYQPNGLRVPVPGVPTTMPAAYRFAANAPRVAAAALYLHPGVRTAIGIAGWLATAGIVWDALQNKWVKTGQDQEVSTGTLYRTNEWPKNGSWFTTEQAACNNALTYVKNSNPHIPYTIKQCSGGLMVLGRSDDPSFKTNMPILSKVDPCPVGWKPTPAGCVLGGDKVLTEPELIEELAPNPMPETIPWELPFPTPLPVDPPYINPEPGPNPEHRPKFVPTGEPVPNPDYDPNAEPGTANQPWHQPGMRITPAPTVKEPLRVNIDPVNRPQAGPEPLPETEPDPDNPDKPKPEEQQSLCEKHPEILACQVLKDSGEKPELKTEAVEFEFTPETGFGGAAACPPPIVVNASGMNLSFSWQPFCDSLGLAKPIILAFAWLSAAFIMLGGRQT